MQPPDGSLHAAELDASGEALDLLPQAPAVFLIHARQGRPYLARTSMLRRRAQRLLRRREHPSRLLNLRDAFERLDYWLTGSALAASMQLYELACVYFPEDYAHVLRLRMPPYVKLLLANQWPRTMVTPYIGNTRALCYGPFRSRGAAEAFESQFLELFQIRRCQEDLRPSPEHPGCIYGEMGKCLRPCQQVVAHAEYGQEVARAGDFLRTGGSSLTRSIIAGRDQLSAEMEFEEAARQHRRLERVEEVLKFRDELTCDIDQLHAVAVARSSDATAVELFFVRGGYWQGSLRVGFELEEGKPVSIDRKLREVLAAVPDARLAARERQERLAVLAKWFYSTWRDGDLLLLPSFEQAPIRKLVNAVSRALTARVT